MTRLVSGRIALLVVIAIAASCGDKNTRMIEVPGGIQVLRGTYAACKGTRGETTHIQRGRACVELGDAYRRADEDTRARNWYDKGCTDWHYGPACLAWYRLAAENDRDADAIKALKFGCRDAHPASCMALASKGDAEEREEAAEHLDEDCEKGDDEACAAYAAVVGVMMEARGGADPDRLRELQDRACQAMGQSKDCSLDRARRRASESSGQSQKCVACEAACGALHVECNQEGDEQACDKARLCDCECRLQVGGCGFPPTELKECVEQARQELAGKGE